MEKISHLWNVNQIVSKFNTPQSENLQTFYMLGCRKISKGTKLPQQKFGPASMCPYCGSLWNTIDHEIRIVKGRRISKSVKKIVKSINKGDEELPKVRESLGRKCIENQKNKLVIKCSVCLKATQIPLSKPKRLKTLKSGSEKTKVPQKRKKRRTKDKTCGLNILGTPKINVKSDLEEQKEKNSRKTVNNTNFITANQKLKKLNINKLKDIVSQGATPQKRKSLHNFLTELC